MEKLAGWFKDKDSVLVAFSGGVDSSVVAKAAFDALGERAIAATAKSPLIPLRELESAKNAAKEIGIKHHIFLKNELENPKFVENSPERCYHCKIELCKDLIEIAKTYGIRCVVDGTNSDDRIGYRPGLRAMKENGVRSPLMELGIGKEDVRKIAKVFGLSTYNKPSTTCLATRIPYGERITKTKLKKIERAEDFIKDLGFEQLRVRYHDPIAKVEVPREDIPKIIKLSGEILKKLKEIGFTYVTLDLEGYRSGSLDEVL